MKEKIYSDWQIVSIAIFHILFLIEMIFLTMLSYGLSEGRMDLKEWIILSIYCLIPVLVLITINIQERFGRKYGRLLIINFATFILFFYQMIGETIHTINYYRNTGFMTKSELFFNIFNPDEMILYVPILISFLIQIWMFKKTFKRDTDMAIV